MRDGELGATGYTGRSAPPLRHVLDRLGRQRRGPERLPDHCEPVGEPLVEERQSAPGEPTQYRVRNQCAWKTNIESDMVAKLTRPVPDPLPQSCGTSWTDWLEDPTQANPCSENRGPAGAPLVKIHRYSTKSPIQYSVRYACYEGLTFEVAEQGGSIAEYRGRLPSILNLDGARAGPVAAATVALTTPALIMTGRRPADYSNARPIALTTPALIMTGRRPDDYSNAPPIALTTPPLVMTGSRIEAKNLIPDRTTDVPLRERPARKE